MQQGGLLALDIATRTGWAYGRIPVRGMTALEAVATKPPQPDSGVILVRSRLGIGHFLSEFVDHLGELLDTRKPSAVVIEAPILPQTVNFETVRKLMAMAGLAEMLATQRGIRRLRFVQPSSVKKHFTGSGRAKKPDMEAACTSRGWVFVDDNEADALAIWDLGCDLYRKERLQ